MESGPSRARFYRTRFDAKGNRIIVPGPIVFEHLFDVRSSEADRERLSHLAATVFDVEGLAAHVASGEPRRGEGLHRAARPGFKRTMSKSDIAASYSGSDIYAGGGPRVPGWGADAMYLEPSLTIRAADHRLDKHFKREARIIRHVRYRRDRTLNQLRYLTPLERLSYLRSLDQCESVTLDSSIQTRREPTRQLETLCPR
jgi:hypothetical protein